MGCKLTRVWRSDANSEYRLRTSRSYRIRVNKLKMRTLILPRRHYTYTSSDCISDIVPASFMILPRIGYQYRQIRILVKNLLYPAVVSVSLRHALLLFSRLAISEVGQSCLVGWKVWCYIFIGGSGGWRSDGSVEAYSNRINNTIT